MRILLISRACSPTAGGMERLSYELIAELQKLPKAHVTTIVRQSTGRLGAILFVLTSLPRGLSLARKADVVHLGDPVLSLHGWLIQKILKKTVAVTIHGLDVTYKNPLYLFYLRLFGSFDMALPISEKAQQLLEESIIKNRESKIITPGVHDRYFDQSITRNQLVTLLEQTAHFSLPTTHRVLLTAGRLVKRKGHAWFIEHVLPHLPSNTVYLIAGDGPERENIEEMVRSGRGEITSESSSDNRKPHVLLLGRVSDENLKILYNTVDAFVQPNISVPNDAEGFGIVLLEAALCQRPVIASRLDGIPEAIHHGQNGTLLPAQDAAAWITELTKLHTSSPVAREYTLQNFSWPTQAQKYYQAFRTIVAIPSRND